MYAQRIYVDLLVQIRRVIHAKQNVLYSVFEGLLENAQRLPETFPKHV